MQKFLRILKYATYPFLWLSMFLFCGISFTFLTEFTVENRTEETIVVTPVGTGESGHRGPLPVKMFAFPPFAAFRSGEFRLAPDESISVQYDMDDITLSELVVTCSSFRIVQI